MSQLEKGEVLHEAGRSGEHRQAAGRDPLPPLVDRVRQRTGPTRGVHLLDHGRDVIQQVAAPTE